MKFKQHLRLLAFIGLCSLTATTALANTGLLGSAAAATPELHPKPQQVLIDQVVHSLLEHSHYSGKKLDDTLSAYILDHYLERLDPGRSYFTQHDIDSFQVYRTKLDDAIKKGDLEPAFAIYDVYQKRVNQRIAYAIGLLQHKPDLSADETYKFDREHALWPADDAAAEAIWKKRVKNDAIGLLLTGKSWKDTAEVLTKRYENFLHRAHQVNSNDVFDLFINAYARALDPHTDYFSPSESQEFEIRMSLKLEGVGAALVSQDEYVTVARVIPGGPAAISGKIHPDDRITAVAQGDHGKLVDVVGWRLDDVVKLIRGNKGTVVRLQILPAGAAPGSAEKVVRLVRNTVELEQQAAQKDLIKVTRDGKEYRIGVITVPAFYSDFQARMRGDKDYRSTTRDVHKLIDEFNKEGGIDGLVIDLRNNGGGSLDEATELTGLFINKGPVVQLRSSDGHIEVNDDTDPEIAYGGPLAVLVNRFSASASEIFTGAIQDYHRGLIVGSTTYGKGTVQNLIDLRRWLPNTNPGQLKMTIGKFYRITGSSTQDKGVTPDITLPSSIDDKEFGESTQDNALPWDKIEPTDYSIVHDHVIRDLPTLIKDHKARVAGNAEYALFVKGVEEIKAEHAKDSVSLNLDTRRTERDQNRKKQLDRENEWRKLLGQKPLKSLDDDTGDDKTDIPDVQLNETADILVDMSRMDGNKLAASRKTSGR